MRGPYVVTSERRQFARALRRNPTRAEDILWAQLGGSRFHGAKFRRQVPLNRYVVDFYCHAAKLAVDLDGRQHEWFGEYDAGRTEVLIRSARLSSMEETANDRCRRRRNSRPTILPAS